ncbi:hypothetical protein PR202_ga14771 [Eleusine coracana subsp. coracana]|uniref:Uncharacterized protein n=1 Tax=Eleusine coracana subsp. coracana TaxID=191504 RepID=A0AAV5CI16_ELECO|nr:hypothetical protein PR202_ga14771 [Eleusine coracana subsp. coracana]
MTAIQTRGVFENILDDVMASDEVLSAAPPFVGPVAGASRTYLRRTEVTSAICGPTLSGCAGGDAVAREMMRKPDEWRQLAGGPPPSRPPDFEFRECSLRVG